ncbi:tetratricopeptide repeat protein, partial [Streptomyces hygroscopicus]
KVSRHYDAARIAIVRVLSGRLGHPDALPTAEDLAEVRARLPRLYLDEGRESGPARDRLLAETLEVTLDWAERRPGAAGPVAEPAGQARQPPGEPAGQARQPPGRQGAPRRPRRWGRPASERKGRGAAARERARARSAVARGRLPAVAGGGWSAPEASRAARKELVALRAELERTLRRLARQADSPEALGALVDRANAIRPMTRV